MILDEKVWKKGYWMLSRRVSFSRSFFCCLRWISLEIWFTVTIIIVSIIRIIEIGDVIRRSDSRVAHFSNAFNFVLRCIRVAMPCVKPLLFIIRYAVYTHSLSWSHFSHLTTTLFLSMWHPFISGTLNRSCNVRIILARSVFGSRCWNERSLWPRHANGGLLLHLHMTHYYLNESEWQSKRCCTAHVNIAYSISQNQFVFVCAFFFLLSRSR